MKVTRILIRFLLLFSLIGGGVYLVRQQGYLENFKPLEKWKDTQEEVQGSIKGITDNISDQTNDLTSRGKEVGEHVNNVLSSYIEPTEEKNNQSQDSPSSNPEESSEENSSEDSNSKSVDDDKPIYEEALDYGKYLYCQQVIKDYEQQHP